jgi:excisionase family DNA binding protein
MTHGDVQLVHMSVKHTPMGDERTQRLTCTVEEAAEPLGIARASAYQAARRGELPTVKIGRRLLVPRQRLEQMLDGDPSE